MAAVSYYASLVLTSLFCLLAMFVARRKYINRIWTVRKAKTIYSIIALVIGISSGTLMFHGMVSMFKLLGFESFFGHGEVLLAAIFFNILVSLLLVVVGCIVIGWKNFSSGSGVW